MRRFTRLTNAFSRKLENHIAAIALHYNFVRIQQTLRITPAMAAGVATGPWEVSDIVVLLEAAKNAHEPVRRAGEAERRTQKLSGKGPALGF